jgi:hypothetical protein
MKKYYIPVFCILFFAICFFLLIGCEHERGYNEHNNTDYYGYNGYPRYVSVDIYAYTSWPIDIYLGDAYIGHLNPGGRTDFSKELYNGERLRINVIIHRPDGAYEKSMSFDDDYSNYHVNVYDGWIERY